jgi:hypothetical protein
LPEAGFITARRGNSGRREAFSGELGMTHRTLRGVLAGLALLLLAPPAGASAGLCPSQPVAQRFAPWSDPAWYAGLPGGGFEVGTAAWTLAGGGAVGEGNEPFHIGTPADHRSLRLPPGGSGTSPAICIGADHPTLRLVARNGGPPTGSLTVSAVVSGLTGETRAIPLATLTARDWEPTAPIPVTLNVLALALPQSVAFRFEAAGGDWAIDDVYIDPYGKG